MIEKTAQVAAGELAGRAISQVNNIIKAAKGLIDNGSPAMPQMGYPALTPSDITTALGADAVTQINAAYAAINPA